MYIEKLIEKFGPPPQWTPNTEGTGMKQIGTNQIAEYVGLFRNVQTVEKVCNCSLHRGDTMRQINANLPDGTPIVILEDMFGYHISIGDYDPDYAPPAVNEREAAQIISKALMLP